MPKFAYSAIDATGAEIEGTTKADTIGTARSILVEKNLFPIRIEESRGMFDFELTTQGQRAVDDRRTLVICRNTIDLCIPTRGR